MKLNDLLFIEDSFEPRVESSLDSIVCSDCDTPNHLEDWEADDDIAVYCEICGDHAAIRCPNCGYFLDPIRETIKVIPYVEP